MSAIIFNGGLGFILLVTYVYSVQDIAAQIINTTLPFPFIGVFTAATGSVAGGIGLTIPPLVISFCSGINSIAAGSRQAWSLARDDGLPFSKWLTRIRVVDSTPLPLNAMVGTLGITIVIALLNLGGQEIVNSILALQSAAVGSTYFISVGCILWRRLYGAPLPPARWSLGRCGVPLNLVALLFQTFQTVMSFFPLFAQTNAEQMNWAVAVYGGVALIALVNYLVYARSKYRGPVVHVVKDD